MNRILFFVITSVILFSCSDKKLGRKEVELSPVTVTGKNTGLDIYRATATRFWDITHTRVALSFNWKEKTAEGRAWLNLHPYAYATDSLVLDAKSMKIDSVVLTTNNVNRPLSFDYRHDQLKIRFDQVYSPKDSIQLYIKYIAMPYAAPSGGSKAITDDRGLYFINTDHKIPGKPAQIWTQGETEANSHWLPTIDKPNERFTVQVELSVPDSFTTLSNGYLAKQVRGANNMRTDIWVMDKPIQTYAVMFAIGKFSVIKDEWNGKEVSYYVEPEYAPYARTMFKNTPEMIEYFSNITGVSYPWVKYSQIVVRDYVSGAMENTTASLFGEFMNQNRRENADKDYEDIVSHELFHQWFGDYVTAESWSNLTVNESFANYSEQLWRRFKYGDASADELAFKDLWAYLSQTESNDQPLVRFKYAEREEMFDRISYQKGGAILNYLHKLIGDDAFNRAMNIYLTKNALQPAEATNWRLAVEEATGKDMKWFFSQWYYRGGHPRLDIKYAYNDADQQLTVTVTQKNDTLYRLPLKAKIVSGNNTVVDWDIRKRTETFYYNYQNGIRPVVIPDVQNWLVGRIKDNKTPKEWLIQYKNSGDNVIKKITALTSIQQKLEDTSSQAIMDLALIDKDEWVRESALMALQRVKSKKWQDKWLNSVNYLVTNDGNHRVRAAAFNVLGQWKKETAKKEMLEALSDSSYMVAGAALKALNNIDKDTAYPIAKRILQTKPRAELQSAVWQIIGEQGNAGDFALFEQEAAYFYGTKKIAFADALSSYLENVKDIEAFKRAVNVHVNIVKSESIKDYRLVLGTILLNTAAVYKERVRDSRSNAERNIAEQKLEILRSAMNEIVSAENEEENLNQYRPAMKSIFGP